MIKKKKKKREDEQTIANKNKEWHEILERDKANLVLDRS